MKKLTYLALTLLTLTGSYCEAGFCRRLLVEVGLANPFAGNYLPSRVPIVELGRPAMPFPHPWNYDRPLDILDGYFYGAEEREGGGKHNRYFKVPFFSPVLVSRDPKVIRAITANTGDKAGQFNRDQLPIQSISRNIGASTLLNVNEGEWRKQKIAAASPFGKTAIFRPEVFQEFQSTFRSTMIKRVEEFRARLLSSGQATLRVQLEPEIKAVMLEMLTNNFFGAEIPYEDIRHRFVPSLETSIDHMVQGQVTNPLGLPASWMRGEKATKAFELYEELTDLCLQGRITGAGLWKHFAWDGPDERLRPNIKAFLAGALEATTSYASWAISHLSTHPEVQEKLFRELADIREFSPETLNGAKYLSQVMNETLRLTPSLYFLPRTPKEDLVVETSEGETMMIPAGTHIFLYVWGANRHEDHWGIRATGYPALDFVPERWNPENMAAHGRSAKDNLHFGFGHGPRVCPGKHLGEMEVALTVGAFVKVFKFSAAHPEIAAKAAVSTKPGDGVDLVIELRNH